MKSFAFVNFWLYKVFGQIKWTVLSGTTKPVKRKNLFAKIHLSNKKTMYVAEGNISEYTGN